MYIIRSGWTIPVGLLTKNSVCYCFGIGIEGLWGRVLNNIADDKIDISILCVKLDSPVTLNKVLKVINILKDIGLRLVHWEKDNYLFIQDSLLAQKPS